MGPTILLVEDNPMTRKLVRFALERDGCELLDAIDARTALRILESRKPDLILQDLCLPDMDGFELVAELRKRCGPGVPILAFSGFISRADEAHVAAAGFDGIIAKPVEPSRLVQIVRGHLPLASVASGQALGGRTVVVADDDPLQLKLLRFRLGQIGCVVMTAGDGAEALALAKGKAPDAIVSDVMMPGLDGFALAMAVRSEPGLSQVPIILVTSTYVEATDRDLALRAGANDLVQRTSDLKDVVEALRAAFEITGEPVMPPPSSAHVEEVERERVMRVQRQLERQVSINAGLTQRCTMQASELAVLSGITEAVVKSGDLASALDDVLALCFDAGGVSVGVLYLVDPGGHMQARVLGGTATWAREDLDGFFGHAELLRQVIDAGHPALLLEPPWENAGREVLARSGAVSALLLPLLYGRDALGALFVMSRSRQLDDPDWVDFAQGVAGQITLAVALTRSIEARAASEAAAVEARSQLRAVFDNAPDFVMSVDRDGVIRFINRVLAQYTMEQVVGSHWLTFTPPDQHAALASALDLVLTTGEARTLEATMTGPDGTPLWFSSNIGPVHRNGDISGAVIIARDVTEKKRTEAQLIASDRMASVGILAAGVAHEINNPLAVVLANLELALRDATELTKELGLSDDLRDELHDARDCAERIRTIVRDLKIFSRAEEHDRGPVDTRRVLESTLRMVWNEIRHRARLVKQYGEVPPVEANESRLGQVFLNLVVNAAHAIPEGRAEANEIRVSTRLDPSGDVVVEIADTGCGMSPEIQKQLFTPFFTTKPVGVGTGLGLAICHRIVEQLLGRIEVESESGKGSVFRIHLPPARSEDTSVEPLVAAPAASRRGRILVIDDEPALAAVIRRALSAEHDVVAATRAQEALDHVSAGERFDVILCDLMMPDVNGMDFHAELERSAPDQAERVIFMTGGAFTVAAREFLERAPNLRIEKPFDHQQLRALVNDRIR